MPFSRLLTSCGLAPTVSLLFSFAVFSDLVFWAGFCSLDIFLSAFFCCCLIPQLENVWLCWTWPMWEFAVLGENAHLIPCDYLHVYFQLWWLEIYKVQIWKVKNKCSGLYFYFCMHKAQPHPWTDVCTVRSVCMYAFNIQIHLSLLPLSTEWQFLAEEEPSRSQGTCPLLPPPVPALISNMSSHHHRWMQRKHFLGRQC